MTWGRLDDGLHSHVKPMRAGLEAMGLWALCQSWCSDKETDGRIPREVVAKLAGGEDRADRLGAQLVAAGLWEVVDGGWLFHDWADYNPLHRDLVRERKAKASAGKVGGLRSGQARRSKGQKPPSTGEAPASAPASALLDPPANPHSRSQSLPDPDPNSGSGDPPGGGFLQPSEPRGRKRATRCPPSTDPGAVAWCQAWGIPPPDLGSEVARWMDYWASRSKDATSTDWAARWRSRPAWTRDGNGGTGARRESPQPAPPAPERHWKPGEGAGQPGQRDTGWMGEEEAEHGADRRDDGPAAGAAGR